MIATSELPLPMEKTCALWTRRFQRYIPETRLNRIKRRHTNLADPRNRGISFLQPRITLFYQRNERHYIPGLSRSRKVTNGMSRPITFVTFSQPRDLGPVPPLDPKRLSVEELMAKVSFSFQCHFFPSNGFFSVAAHTGFGSGLGFSTPNVSFGCRPKCPLGPGS